MAAAMFYFGEQSKAIDIGHGHGHLATRPSGHDMEIVHSAKGMVDTKTYRSIVKQITGLIEEVCVCVCVFRVPCIPLHRSSTSSIQNRSVHEPY
jgi:hypothetical protein